MTLDETATTPRRRERRSRPLHQVGAAARSPCPAALWNESGRPSKANTVAAKAPSRVHDASCRSRESLKTWTRCGTAHEQPGAIATRPASAAPGAAPTRGSGGFPSWWATPHKGSGRTPAWRGIGREAEGVAVSFCEHCHRPMVWHDRLPIWPATTSAPPPLKEMPKAARADFEEAEQVVDRSPQSAAALLRLALQKLCRYLGRPARPRRRHPGPGDPRPARLGAAGASRHAYRGQRCGPTGGAGRP